jgi:hypothetical protein
MNRRYKVKNNVGRTHTERCNAGEISSYLVITRRDDQHDGKFYNRDNYVSKRKRLYEVKE